MYAIIITIVVIIFSILEIIKDYREEKRRKMLVLYLINEKRNQINMTLEELEIEKRDDEEICSICLSEEAFKDQSIVRLPCSHTYHK